LSGSPNPPYRIERVLDFLGDALDEIAIERHQRQAGHQHVLQGAGRGGGNLLGALLGFLRVFLVAVAHSGQDRLEAGIGFAVDLAVFARPVGAADDRLAVGGEEHRQRPAAALALHVEGGHVDLIDIGALFAIDLDADEVVIEYLGHLLVVERLALHHMAPVARAVTDRQEDELLLLLGLLEGLRAPGIPVGRVVGVHEEVRAGLLR
jgi:hypothetical protein